MIRIFTYAVHTTNVRTCSKSTKISTTFIVQLAKTCTCMYTQFSVGFRFDQVCMGFPIIVILLPTPDEMKNYLRTLPYTTRATRTGLTLNKSFSISSQRCATDMMYAACRQHRRHQGGQRVAMFIPTMWLPLRAVCQFQCRFRNKWVTSDARRQSFIYMLDLYIKLTQLLQVPWYYRCPNNLLLYVFCRSFRKRQRKLRHRRLRHNSWNSCLRAAHLRQRRL